MDKIKDAVSGMSTQRKALQSLPKPQERDAVEQLLKVVPRLKSALVTPCSESPGNNNASSVS